MDLAAAHAWFARAAQSPNPAVSDDARRMKRQIEVLLADHLQPFGAAHCLADMDAWGYSFREGSATAWFNGDGREARSWLLSHRLIQANGIPSWLKRS